MVRLCKDLTNISLVALLPFLGGCGAVPNSAFPPALPSAREFVLASSPGTNPVTIHEFSMAQFSGVTGNVDGGITMNGTGSVWVTANSGIIHISPIGAANSLNLSSLPQPTNLRPILWRNDQTLWFMDLPGRQHQLNETSLSGSLLSFTDAGLFGTQSNIVSDAGHGIWVAICDTTCVPGNTDGGVLFGPNQGDPLGPWVGNTIASGADNYLYMTERNLNTTASQVLRISLSGTFTNTYALPAGSIAINTGCCGATFVSSGIAGGPDHNLWVAESGINKIARLSIGGSITQFHIPTANSDPRSIVAGNDGNMWFTENRGNKIGRISMTGHITEYPVPSTNSGPDGISNCEIFGCARSVHGHVWFVEDNTNKAGRLDF